MSEQLGILDIITLLSFVLQIENQRNIINLSDVQGEVNRAVEDIHGHLKEQDAKLALLLERGENADNKETV